VDPVPDPLLLRTSGSAGIEPGTSGSVAKNSDHQTTEAVEQNKDIEPKERRKNMRRGGSNNNVYINNLLMYEMRKKLKEEEDGERGKEWKGVWKNN
jgi:hypothetical protein